MSSGEMRKNSDKPGTPSLLQNSQPTAKMDFTISREVNRQGQTYLTCLPIHV